MSSEKGFVLFKDLTTLAAWVKWALYAVAFITATSVFLSIQTHQFISNIKTGNFLSREIMISTADAIYQRQSIIATISLITFILSAILICRWIFLANRNLRTFSTKKIEFTPGWAVGWYFIPIAHLWKPYEVMKEIWNFSINHTEAERAHNSPLILKWWWFLWIMVSFLSKIAMRIGTETTDSLQNTMAIYLISDLCMIPLCFILLSIIKQISKAQIQAHKSIYNQVTPKDALPLF